ncbi:MAG TPA: hypothetical protein VGP46_07660 [Acidimicrobiales bacterium]|nr:hypothetical protein [Acidimicrobiales bacterium]
MTAARPHRRCGRRDYPMRRRLSELVISRRRQQPAGVATMPSQFPSHFSNP